MIKWLVISIIALIILGNLGFDIKKSVHSPVAQSNLEYAKDVTVFVWQKYLKEPAKFLWSEVFIKYIWEPSIKILDKKVKGETSVNNKKTLFSCPFLPYTIAKKIYCATLYIEEKGCENLSPINA